MKFHILPSGKNKMRIIKSKKFMKMKTRSYLSYNSISFDLADVFLHAKLLDEIFVFVFYFYVDDTTAVHRLVIILSGVSALQTWEISTLHFG